MPAGPRQPGEFCWINVLTPDPDASREFFAALLRWTYADIPRMGHLIKSGGHDIGGLFDLRGPNVPAGTPPGIGVMVKVASADATAGRIRELGGTARPTFDIAENGRMADCTDPNGAGFDLWEPKRMPGTVADTAAHGVPSWFENLTTDVDRARTFYTELFGWTAEAMPLPGMSYTTFKLGEGYVAGMLAITPEMGSLPPHWGTYFTVDDVDASAGEAERLGGTVFMPPRTVQGVGRFCGITSSQGVMFYVIRYEES